MTRWLVVRGVVASRPQAIFAYTSFLLQTGQGMFRVIRTDLYWQKRDILFLSPGQNVEVAGSRTPDGKLLAENITIIDTGREPEKEERSYGNPGK